MIQHKPSKYLLMLCLAVFVSNAAAQTDTQRKLFRTLYSLALQGHEQQVTNRRAPLDNYPVTHYLDYALLRSQMAQLPIQQINDFKAKHPDSPLNSRLRKQLLDQLGLQQKWSQYLQYHTGFDTGKRQCWYLRASIETKQLQGLAPKIETMWMSGLSVSKTCDPVFNWWQQQGHLTEDLILRRFKLAFESQELNLALYLKNQLAKPPEWVTQALDLMQHPEAALQRSMQWPSHAELPWLIYKTSMRLAKKRPANLYQMWPNIKASHALSSGRIDQIERQMALFAATDYEPFSINAMKQLPATMRDDQIMAWIVRYYLYHEQWHSVLDALQQMPARQLEQDRWQYWLARAHAKVGHAEQAKNIFNQLRSKTNYYGFLAADHMRQPYRLCQTPLPQSNATLALPDAINRAIELHHAGLLTMARSEWNTQYKSLNQNQKVALAERVLNERWYAKAIGIMADLGMWQNYQWRYPVAHETLIKQHANTSQPMPQWVMAIIKQESAWAKDAVSHADAHGLMQLLPSTAGRIASQIGTSFNSPYDLHHPPLNIQLGIQYQKNLFQQFNHPILVAAAYNAGEGKSIDWSQGFPKSPDVWLETIPYRETRDYITRILSNVTIYDWLINQTPRRISSWMPTMPIDQAPVKPWPNSQVSAQTTQTQCTP